MKKTFKTFALMLLTAFAFSSCVDVPAPFNVPDKGSSSGGSESTEGTPVTCAQAVELTNALADGATSPETYTITGYITEVVGDVSRNQQTFWMADTKDGGRIFEAYWANLPEGVSAFTKGMKVKITGKLMKYVNPNNGSVIAEMKNAIVTILPDEGGETPPVEGTPVTCAEAVELTNALADNGTSTETYTVTGYITEVVGSVSRNQQTFWMADTKDGGRVFEAYYANLPEGVSAFTKGMKVKITGQLLKYVNNSGQVTPEIKNATVVVLPDEGGETPPIEGTEVTCAQAVELTNALADNATSTETYTVTGYITEVVGSVSRNQQTFWMADTKDGGKVFEAYYANLPEGVTAFTKGMKVKITGQLLKYVNNSGQVTPEIKNADVVILPDDGGDTPTPPIEGTDVTCAQAVELTNALADNATSTETYTVTGYITEVVGNVSRNQQTFWMADTQDGGKVFEAYYANLPEGVSAFAVGMKVKITGQLLKYVNNSGQVTPEIKNADVVILEQGGDTPGPTPGPGGDEVTELVNGGFEEWVSDAEPLGWKSASTASNATLSKSTEARSGSFACQIAAPGTGNKRLATQEITLEAGNYTFSFYAKSTTANICQTRAGYVPVNGTTVGTYKYGDYVDINNNGWTLVTYDFTLDSATTLCLLVMNPKDSDYSKSQNVLIDDATLVKK
ncbi:MAG: hypothetical protein J6Y59_08570 [Bacteroidaceae bacterium]|nr:hypothetical protein [Bacteroidaceae bacterium]